MTTEFLRTVPESIREAGLPHRQVFPKNRWYIAAAAEELRSEILGRKINDEKVALFRRADGSVCALYDACPHKGYPLSKGRVIGDELRCGYHGIQFDGSGRCTAIPSQEILPAAMCARAYPVVERDLFIWIWTGEPALADPANIPNFGFEERPDFHRQLTFSREVGGNAQFLLENVLDHTHFSYLHAGGFDNDPDEMEGGAEFARAPLHLKVEGDTICVWRDFDAMPVSETSALIFDVTAGSLVKRRLETRSCPASGYLVTRDRFWHIDDPDVPISEAIGSGTVTPIDDSHCLHIAMWSSSYPHHHELKDNIARIIGEDADAAELLQRHFTEEGSATELSLGADKASILARRMVASAAGAEGRRF